MPGIVSSKQRSRVERREVAFSHAVRQLTEREYQKILTRVSTNRNFRDCIKVNGKPYAVGVFQAEATY